MKHCAGVQKRHVVEAAAGTDRWTSPRQVVSEGALCVCWKRACVFV